MSHDNKTTSFVKMKDLAKATKLEQEEFFRSFDHVLSDVDGVILWHPVQNIPGVGLGFQALKKLGKTFTFISNNSTKTTKTHVDLLQGAECDVTENDVIIPIQAIIHHLKKINFDKKIFVIGMWCVKEYLTNAGFKLLPDDILPDKSPEFLVEVLKTLNHDPDIGAVIFEGDYNTNFLKLQQAVTYLKNPDVLFITGATDSKLVPNKNLKIIGPGYFLPPILELTEREPLMLAKPSKHLNSYVLHRLKIDDPSRVLFIGDSIPMDMCFGTNCGYKKLLVLSGLTERGELENWKYPEEYKPNYYIDSLRVVHEIVESLKN